MSCPDGFVLDLFASFFRSFFFFLVSLSFLFVLALLFFVYMMRASVRFFWMVWDLICDVRVFNIERFIFF